MNFRKKRKLASALSVVLCMMMLFAYVDTASAAGKTSDRAKRAKVKQETVKIIGVSETDDGNIEVKWQKAKGKYKIKNYRIYVSESRNGNFCVLTNVLLGDNEYKANTFSYTDYSAYEEGDTLYYKVRGFKNIGGKICYTRYSSVKSITVKDDTATVTTSSATNVKYHWEQAKDKKGNPITKDGKPVMQRKYLESFDRQDPINSKATLHYTNIAKGQQINMNDENQLIQLFQQDIKDANGNSVGSLQGNWAKVADAVIGQSGKCACEEDWPYSSSCVNGGNNLNLDVDLASKTGRTQGKPKFECCTCSGLRYARRMSDVRTYMKNQVIDRVGTGGIRKNPEDIMNLGNAMEGDDKPVLKELMDDKNRDILYSIGTASYSRRASNVYFYVSVGLIFYDFKLTPIADKNIDYLSSIDGMDAFSDTESRFNVQGISKSTYPSIKDLSQTNDSGLTVSKTLTHQKGMSEISTYSHSNSASVTKEHGANLELSFTEKWLKDFFETSQKVGFNYKKSEAFSNSSTKATSKAFSETTTGSTTVATPPHTFHSIQEVTETRNIVDSQSIPMELQYKVAIVSFSEQLWSNWRTNYVRTLGYDIANFTSEFGVGDEQKKRQENGYDARESLDKRAIVKADEKEYDTTNGEVHGFYRVAKKPSYSIKNVHHGLKWNEIKNHDNGQGKNAINAIVNNVPILANGAKLTAKTETMHFKTTEPLPLYQMNYVGLKSKGVQEDPVDKLDMNVGEVRNIKNAGIDVQGLDNGGPNKVRAPFYGFGMGDGYWVECDKYGNIVSDSQKSGCIKLVNNGSDVEALETGTAYIMWAISNDPAIQKKYNTKAQPNGTSVNKWDKARDIDAVINSNTKVTITIK